VKERCAWVYHGDEVKVLDEWSRRCTDALFLRE
jgi:hypothetical protein